MAHVRLRRWMGMNENVNIDFELFFLNINYYQLTCLRVHSSTKIWFWWAHGKSRQFAIVYTITKLLGNQGKWDVSLLCYWLWIFILIFWKKAFFFCRTNITSHWHLCVTGWLHGKSGSYLRYQSTPQPFLYNNTYFKKDNQSYEADLGT